MGDADDPGEPGYRVMTWSWTRNESERDVSGGLLRILVDERPCHESQTMHYSKTYASLLLTLPPELRDNAIQYREVRLPHHPRRTLTLTHWWLVVEETHTGRRARARSYRPVA